jgi:hypothetical protein
MRSKDIIGAAKSDIELNGQVYERVDTWAH